MANWDKKYFVTELKPNIVEATWTPKYNDNEGRRLFSLDNDVIKGAFYMETAWFLPGKWPETKGDEGVIKPHTHDFDEAVAYVGTDPDNRYDLGGEIEFWIDGKKNIIDKSFIAFIPAGIEHGPITIKRIDKPIFHFTSGTSRSYF
jgi:hypothetical protein